MAGSAPIPIFNSLSVRFIRLVAQLDHSDALRSACRKYGARADIDSYPPELIRCHVPPVPDFVGGQAATDTPSRAVSQEM